MVSPTSSIILPATVFLAFMPPFFFFLLFFFHFLSFFLLSSWSVSSGSSAFFFLCSFPCSVWYSSILLGDLFSSVSFFSAVCSIYLFIFCSTIRTVIYYDADSLGGIIYRTLLPSSLAVPACPVLFFPWDVIWYTNLYKNHLSYIPPTYLVLEYQEAVTSLLLLDNRWATDLQPITLSPSVSALTDRLPSLSLTMKVNAVTILEPCTTPFSTIAFNPLSPPHHHLRPPPLKRRSLTTPALA